MIPMQFNGTEPMCWAIPPLGLLVPGQRVAVNESDVARLEATGLFATVPEAEKVVEVVKAPKATKKEEITAD